MQREKLLVLYNQTESMPVGMHNFPETLRRISGIRGKCIPSLSQASASVGAGDSGVAVLVVTTKEDVAGVLALLIEKRAIIRAGYLKVVVYNRFQHPKVPSILQSRGCSEILNLNLNSTALFFKIQALLAAVEATLQHGRFSRAAAQKSSYANSNAADPEGAPREWNICASALEPKEYVTHSNEAIRIRGGQDFAKAREWNICDSALEGSKREISSEKFVISGDTNQGQHLDTTEIVLPWKTGAEAFESAELNVALEELPTTSKDEPCHIELLELGSADVTIGASRSIFTLGQAVRLRLAIGKDDPENTLKIAGKVVELDEHEGGGQTLTIQAHEALRSTVEAGITKLQETLAARQAEVFEFLKQAKGA